jgi:hypothetical protein
MVDDGIEVYRVWKLLKIILMSAKDGSFLVILVFNFFHKISDFQINLIFIKI